MTVRVYDGLNYVRRLLEKDGRAPRNIINSMIILPPTDVAIWCWDAPNAKASRQKVFPAYKANRLPPPDNLWPTVDLIRRGLAHTRAIQMKVDGFEADDLIATICRTYQEPIHIYSNDGDLRQLCVHPRITIDATNKQPPHLVRLYKTLVGDPSDNIPGVRGFGEKAWENASKDALFSIIDDLLAGRPLDADDIEGLPTKVVNWIRENSEQVLAMWTVTALLTVPVDLFLSGMRAGEPDPVAASAVLAEFFH